MWRVRKARAWLALLLLAVAAVLIHGYHLGVDDQAMYLPAIKKILDPALYPHDSRFFLVQTRWTVFDELVAFSTRLTRLSLEWVIFLEYLLTVFLVLAACWKLSQRCFPERRLAQWGAVATVWAVLPLYATGTRVQMMDPCLHPRGLATAALLFAVVALLDRRAWVFVWLAAAAVIHPQMTLFGVLHLGALALIRWRTSPALSLALLPAWQGASEVWRRIALTRTHHYPLKWTWYEWLGVLLPIVSLLWLARQARQSGARVREDVCRAFALSAGVGVALAIVVSTVPGLERLVTLQFMRVLHLVYFVSVLMLGGVMADLFLRKQPLRWVLMLALLTTPVVIGYSFYFPASPHIEWPGKVPQNPWLQAFDWIRHHTPRDAFFALDPQYINSPGEDAHGFRALAERSMLADYVKDRGVAALFPELADAWWQQTKDSERWREFGPEDFHRLQEKYGVSWVVLERRNAQRALSKDRLENSHRAALSCPYENEVVLVCRIQ